MGSDSWSDPYDIIPESFRERFSDCETAADALSRAEAQKSSTPKSERRRCPYCGARSVRAKSLKREHQRKDGKFYCPSHGCRRHFDQPADETTIPMTDDRTDPFSWNDREDLDDPDTRGEGPLFASLDEERRIALAIVLYRPWADGGPSLRELGELFPNSRYWVGERNREWKAGDHRDLVGAPRSDGDPSRDVDASASVEAAADGGTRRSRWGEYGSD